MLAMLEITMKTVFNGIFIGCRVLKTNIDFIFLVFGSF